MATVFMKWLERSPRMYDRGISLLTVGRLSRLWDLVASKFVRPGMRVLELGCGTGGLTCRMAKAGAEITAIDVAPEILSIAMDAAREAGISEKVHIERLDAIQVGDLFSGQRFDLIVTSLLMSELTVEERSLVLDSCVDLIEPDGKLIIIDEVIPKGILNRLRYLLFRMPLSAATWILTRTSTKPLKDVPTFLERQGFELEKTKCYLGRSLCLFSASPTSPSLQAKPGIFYKRLWHEVTLKTLLIDLWALFFRIIPPYPKIKPGLYVIGQPNSESTVLVTGNFNLTVRRVLKSLDGELNAWLLVVDSAGINVWCASGGGFLTADKVVSAIRTSRLGEIVRHRQLILPQLSAVGVDGKEIRMRTDWEIRWGPVRAEDIPGYVQSGFQKSEAMRSIGFPIMDRLEMVSGTLGFYGLLLLVPIAIFWRSLLLPVVIALITLAFFYAVVMPWLPGKDGLAKSIPLAVMAISGAILYSLLWDPVPAEELFNRALGITALSVFIAGEFQGMSPLMRGEQANWIPEAMIAVILGLMYWLLPHILGWR